MAATGVWVTYTVDPESTHITDADGAAVHVEDRYTVREIHSSEIAALRATQRDSAPSKLVRAIHVPFGANVAHTIRAQARPSAADQPREAPTKTRTSNLHTPLDELRRRPREAPTKTRTSNPKA